MSIDRRHYRSAWVFVCCAAACNPSPQLGNPNSMAFDGAGFSVSIDGDFAIVGVPRSDTVGANAGKALMYVRSGDSWSLEQTVVASMASSNANLGWSVDISGDHAIAGAFTDASLNAITGAAYIFERQSGVWTETAIVFGDTLIEDGFGFTVAIDGDYAVVGAPNAPPPTFTGPGAAWVYHRNPSGVWVEQAQLGASDAVDFIEFGRSVDIDGDVIVVGATRGVTAATVAGAAYVFRRQGNNWSEEAKLVAFDPAYHDFFGTSVAVRGNVVVVGSEDDDPNGADSGSAYVFRHDAATDDWEFQQKLIPADGEAGDNFGRSVAVDGPRILIGAWLADGDTSTTGAAYLFRASPTDWQFGDKLFWPVGEYGDGYGFSVELSDDCGIIGAVNDDVGGMQDTGAAFIYCDLPGAVPPGFTLDIICCIEVPDPLGPVVITTRVRNAGETSRIGRRWIEWMAADGTSTVVAGPNAVTVAPGEPREERHVLPRNGRTGGQLVLYWQDEHGIRTTATDVRVDRAPPSD